MWAVTLELQDKVLNKIAKLIGCKVPDASEIDKSEFERILRNQGKYEDFMSVVDFLKQSQRNDITDFMHKVKKVVHQHIESSSWYINIEVDLLRQECIEIRAKLHFNQKKAKSVALDLNNGKTFISFDIRGANFAALKSISTTVLSTWEDFLRGLVPNDVRSASKRNIEKGTAGLTVDVPQCLYVSKFFRMFLLGDLKKLKFIWELENIKYLAKICPFLSAHHFVIINSDEIIIEVQNPKDADTFLTVVPLSPIHRVTQFQITTIDGYAKNTILKTFSDGSKALMNVDPRIYDELFMRYIHT
jgi:hypothetical protein